MSLKPERTWGGFQKLVDLLQLGCKLESAEFWGTDAPFESLKENYFKKLPVLRSYLEKFCELGVQFCYPGAWDYPTSLETIPTPPVFLSYKGSPVWLQQWGLAIVGSRQPNKVTELWCERELPYLVQADDIFTVSGGAYGVDQIAHRLSLRSQRPTVAVLPSGLQKMYPASLQDWEDEVLRYGGALVSEFWPDRGMEKHFFDQRNRLISGLALGTLILQARRKSGTLLTARHCVEQNRPLFVVPSHPLDALSRGGLDLLAEGAQWIFDGRDLASSLSAEISIARQKSQNLIRISGEYTH